METIGVVVALVTLAVAVFLQSSPSTVAENFRGWLRKIPGRARPPRKRSPHVRVPVPNEDRPTEEPRRQPGRYHGELTAEAIRAHLRINGVTLLYGYSAVDPAKDCLPGALHLGNGQLLSFRRDSPTWTENTHGHYEWEMALDQNDDFVCKGRYGVSRR